MQRSQPEQRQRFVATKGNTNPSERGRGPWTQEGFTDSGEALSASNPDLVSIPQEDRSAVPGTVNGWLSLFGFPAANYFKDSMGVVHLQGALQGGTVDAVAFTLPEGYRPQPNNQGVFAVCSNGAYGQVKVQDNGDVVPMTPCNNNSVFFDGIVFATH